MDERVVSEEEVLDQTLFSHDLQRKQVPNDTFSLYRALADAVWFSQSLHRRVRFECLKEIWRRQSTLRPLVALLLKDLEEDMNDDGDTLTRYIQKTWRGERSGGVLELQGFMLRYEIDIVVYDVGGILLCLRRSYGTSGVPSVSISGRTSASQWSDVDSLTHDARRRIVRLAYQHIKDHFDPVYPLTSVPILGVAQKLVYDMVMLSMMPRELCDTDRPEEKQHPSHVAIGGDCGRSDRKELYHNVEYDAWIESCKTSDRHSGRGDGELMNENDAEGGKMTIFEDRNSKFFKEITSLGIDEDEGDVGLSQENTTFERIVPSSSLSPPSSSSRTTTTTTTMTLSVPSQERIEKEEQRKPSKTEEHVEGIRKKKAARPTTVTRKVIEMWETSSTFRRLAHRTYGVLDTFAKRRGSTLDERRERWFVFLRKFSRDQNLGVLADPNFLVCLALSHAGKKHFHGIRVPLSMWRVEDVEFLSGQDEFVVPFGRGDLLNFAEIVALFGESRVFQKGRVLNVPSFHLNEMMQCIIVDEDVRDGSEDGRHSFPCGSSGGHFHGVGEDAGMKEDDTWEFDDEEEEDDDYDDEEEEEEEDDDEDDDDDDDDDDDEYENQDQVPRDGIDHVKGHRRSYDKEVSEEHDAHTIDMTRRKPTKKRPESSHNPKHPLWLQFLSQNVCYNNLVRKDRNKKRLARTLMTLQDEEGFIVLDDDLLQKLGLSLQVLKHLSSYFERDLVLKRILATAVALAVGVMGVGDDPGPFHETFTKAKQRIEHDSAKIRMKHDDTAWQSIYQEMQNALRSADRRRIGSPYFDWKKGEMFLSCGGSFDFWMVFASRAIGEAYAWELPLETYYYQINKG
eukprot:TRINITY_DN349_c1_g1_i1.p1 TRINITY_DN349_c1_g1~~TRINITY_DN349_c1_g1_i1.p1  ORF type:complete len:871 (+),score=241.33 TRINITY_DN349_c1_g1_i1:68-2614(+)